MAENLAPVRTLIPLSQRSSEELSHYSYLLDVQAELERRWAMERSGVDESESNSTDTGLGSQKQEAIAVLEARIAALKQNEQGLLRRRSQARSGFSMWTQANASNLSGVQNALARARAQLVRIRAI